MPRAMNEDGTPWWVSHGPPVEQPSAAEPEQPKGAPVPTPEPEPASETASQSSSDTSTQSSNPLSDVGLDEAMRAGLGLFSAFARVVTETVDSKFSSAAEEPAAPHSVADCGVCPVCVAVAALKEHDERLGGLVESALAGAASGTERLAEAVPNVKDAVSEQLLQAVTRAVMNLWIK